MHGGAEVDAEDKLAEEAEDVAVEHVWEETSDGVAEEGKAMSEPPLQSEHTAPRGALAVVVEELPGLLEELGEEATG